MRFAILLRMLVIVLAASWLGCGGGGGGGIDNDQNITPPPPTLVAAGLSPTGPAVTVGGTVQFTLHGHYSDGSTKDLTSSATWSSSSPLISINNTGLATGLSPGVGNISVNYGSGLITDSTALNVTTMTLNNSILQGNYVFTYSGSDSTGSRLVVGVFVADGQGKITGGQIDSNDSSGVVSTAIPSGSYTVFPDGRGTLNLQSSPMSYRTYRFVLSQDGSAGHLMIFNGVSLGVGTLEKQTPSMDFKSFQGNYVFRMGGMDQVNGSSPNLALIGMLTADGVGSISNGQVHINDNGTIDNGTLPPTPVAFTGTYNGPGPGGRGTATLDAGEGPMNFAFYFVSPDKAYFLETDTANSKQALLGPMEKQTGAPFSLASATGGYIFLSENAGLAGSLAISGQAVLNGAGAILNGVQVETFGTGLLAEGPVLSGSYNIAPDGGAAVSWNLDPGGPRGFLGYMISPTKMFVLQTAPSGWVSAGTAERQMAGPFDLGSLNGTFMMSMSQLQSETTTGQLIADGAGTLTGIADLNEFFGYGTGGLSATYSFPSDHAAFGQGMALVGGEDFYFYMVSPTKLVIFKDANPGPVGIAESQ